MRVHDSTLARLAFPSGAKPGYIYLIESAEVSGGPVKVGFTGRHPTIRLRELEKHSPTALRFLAVFEGTMREEKEWHKRLSGGRLRDEWFTHEAACILFNEWADSRRFLRHEQVMAGEEFLFGLELAVCNALEDLIHCEALHTRIAELAA